jgi:hypothetical protein
VSAAPHHLQGSRYPFGPLSDDRTALERAAFPYARVLPCLHPLVCNAAPASGLIDDWETWSALASAVDAAGRSRVEDAALTRFRCRDGHDPASRLCARCLDGYWLDGLLCRRCSAGFQVLVPVTTVAALLALAVFVRHRVKHARAPPGQTLADEQTAALILWFFQVRAPMAAAACMRLGRLS